MRRPLAHLIATALLVAAVLSKYEAASGFTSLIRFGETWESRRVEAVRSLPVATSPNSSGYDGQFYAQIALDPRLSRPELATALDAPTYRARRILVPAAAAALGGGQAWWTLQAYALLNLACWLALGRLLYVRLLNHDHAFARWIGCMFALGALDSVRQSLVDLPALLLLSLAVQAVERAQPKTASIWGAVGALAKETNLLGSIALVAGEAGHPNRWRRIVGSIVAAAIPFAIWSAYVNARLGNHGQAEGFGNFTWPGAGLVTQIVDCSRNLLAGDFDARFSFGLLGTLALAIQAGCLFRYRQPATAWWRVGVAYAGLMVFLGSWVWSGYWGACRVVLPMTIAFNLLVPGSRAFWAWWICGNIALLHGVWRFL